MKIFKKIISLSLLLMIFVTSSISISAKDIEPRKKTEIIDIGVYEYCQKLNTYAPNGFEYQILGGHNFDKANLAIRIWYRHKDNPIQTYNFGMQTFTNTSSCEYIDKKGFFRQIDGLHDIIMIKAWCQITKDGITKENAIIFD